MLPDWMNPATWASVVVGALATLFGDSYTKLVQQIVQLLFNATLPKPDELMKGWFSFGIGATFGVAPAILETVVVLIGFISIILFNRNHSKKFSRSLIAVLLLGLLGIVFMPLYSMAYELSRAVVQGVLNMATKSTAGTSTMLSAMLNLVFPDDAVGKMVATWFAYIFGYIALIEALLLMLAFLAVLIAYPIAIAFLPLGGPAFTIVNLFNSALITVLVSPPIMGFGFVFPLLVRNYIPGGNLSFISGATAGLGGLFAVVTPIILAVATYRKSKEVMGHITATIADKINIGSMPPLSTRDAAHGVDETRRGSLIRTTFGLATDTFNILDLQDDKKLFGSPSQAAQTLLKVTSVGASAFGHPEVSAAASAAASWMGSREEKAQAAKEPLVPETEGAP